jgi:hypothetical protein
LGFSQPSVSVPSPAVSVLALGVEEVVWRRRGKKRTKIVRKIK